MATAYCQTADVQALIGAWFTLGSSSKPTDAQVTAWIEQKSAQVNAALDRAGYDTVPATGANDLLELKDAVAQAVALQTLYTALGAEQVPETVRETLAGWREFLKNLGDGTIWLPDQQPSRRTVSILRMKRYGKQSSEYTGS